MSDLLSLPRMARRLGLTQRWLRDHADAGKVPCLKAGNRYLFDPTAVQEALLVEAARTRQGGQDDAPVEQGPARTPSSKGGTIDDPPT